MPRGPLECTPGLILNLGEVWGCIGVCQEQSLGGQWDRMEVDGREGILVVTSEESPNHRHYRI
jgi:hypothetical protein